AISSVVQPATLVSPSNGHVIVPDDTTVAVKSSCFSPPAKTVTWRTSPSTTGVADVTDGSADATRKSSADARTVRRMNRFALDMSLYLAPGRFRNRSRGSAGDFAAGITAPPW